MVRYGMLLLGMVLYGKVLYSTETHDYLDKLSKDYKPIKNKSFLSNNGQRYCYDFGTQKMYTFNY